MSANADVDLLLYMQNKPNSNSTSMLLLRSVVLAENPPFNALKMSYCQVICSRDKQMEETWTFCLLVCNMQEP